MSGGRGYGEHMKYRMFILALLVLTLLCSGASAQKIEMEDVFLAFDYPDTWLVVSPQLAKVYAPLLEEHSIDGDVLSQELIDQGVASRAYNEDFTQRLSIVTLADDLSGEIFDMANVTDAQRKTMRTRAENNKLYETTGLRTQDTEWQKEGGTYWLYVHYTITRGDKTVGRGVRYVSVRNGMYVVIDWQKDEGRFSNRELSAFRKRIADLSVTETITEPVHSVKLTATIPAETSTAALTITGETGANASLIAEAPDSTGAMRTLSVGRAGSSGKFSLLVELPEEGEYAITLTAQSEGMNPASVTGTTVYSAKTLPVTLSGIPEDGVVETSTVKITGQTLAGVQIQLVTPFGLAKKRAGNDGSFSFELTTEEEGEYSYTLICDKSGYDQRRIQFTLTRVITDSQERQRIKDGAQKVSYKNLQKNRAEDQGKVMSLYGPVTSVESAGGTHYVRLLFNKGSDGEWFNPVVIVATEEMGVKVGDMMGVVATVAGVFEEQDAAGNAVAVPRFELMFVDRVE